MNQTSKFSTKQIAQIAILAAIASILFYFPEVPILPATPWLKLDFSLLPALIGGFSLGPFSGILILLIKDLTGLLHSSSGFIGELADFLMGAAMILPASLIYKKGKSKKMAWIGMAVGTVSLIVVAVISNQYLLIPMYTAKMNMALDIQKYILASVIPFNAIKGVVISVITYLLYKRLRNAHII